METEMIKGEMLVTNTDDINTNHLRAIWRKEDRNLKYQGENLAYIRVRAKKDISSLKGLISLLKDENLSCQVAYRDGTIRDMTIEISTIPSFDIFPNPATQSLYILCNAEGNSIQSFSLTDSQGKVWKKGNVKKNVTINVSDIPPGIYFFQLQGMNKVQAKIIIIR